VSHISRYYYLFLILFVTSCAGTGTKNFPNLNTGLDKSGSNIYFFRPGAYVGGGIIPSIIVNGTEIGTLGNDEYLETFVKPGEFTIVSKVKGLNSIGMETDSRSGIAKPGKNFFYIVSLKQKFFTGQFLLTETTENGLKQAK
tara:strand:- start:155 stop:580 length:426 start_codon:yes stop_codon:yes gene_type:complete